MVCVRCRINRSVIVCVNAIVRVECVYVCVKPYLHFYCKWVRKWGHMCTTRSHTKLRLLRTGDVRVFNPIFRKSRPNFPIVSIRFSREFRAALTFLLSAYENHHPIPNNKCSAMLMSPPGEARGRLSGHRRNCYPPTPGTHFCPTKYVVWGRSCEFTTALPPHNRHTRTDTVNLPFKCADIRSGTFPVAINCNMLLYDL